MAGVLNIKNKYFLSSRFVNLVFHFSRSKKKVMGFEMVILTDDA